MFGRREHDEGKGRSPAAERAQCSTGNRESSAEETLHQPPTLWERVAWALRNRARRTAGRLTVAVHIIVKST